MNGKLSRIISNIGLDEIYKITNPAVMELISEFDKNPSKNTLADIITDIYQAPYFLDNKERRNLLLQHLSQNDAKQLLKITGAYLEGENVWNLLHQHHFNKQSLQYLYNFFSYSSEKNVADSESSYFSSSTSIEAIYGLFEHQERAAQEIKSYLSTKQSRVLLHMPTGAGKTRTTMSVICDFIRNNSNRTSRHQKLVIWIADTEELCEQAAEEFIKAWSSLGIGKTNLHRFYNRYEQKFSTLNSGGLLVAGMAKLNKRLARSQHEILSLGRNSELIVFDEAHRILAPTYKQLVEVFQSTGKAPLIGLSATPGRKTFDKTHNIKFADFFKKNKVALSIRGYKNPVNYLEDKGYIAKANYHNLPYSSDKIKLTQSQIKNITSGKDIPKKILEQLGVDTKRNILIIESALEELRKNKQIIIFACSVINAEAIYALLKYKGILAGIVTSSTEINKRKATIIAYKECRLNVIVNYGVLTTGFDAPCTNVAIIGRPTTSLTLYSQMVGRAARGIKAGGNESCDIYTVVDSSLPAFQSIAEAFSYWDDVWK